MSDLKVDVEPSGAKVVISEVRSLCVVHMHATFVVATHSNGDSTEMRHFTCRNR